MLKVAVGGLLWLTRAESLAWYRNTIFNSHESRCFLALINVIKKKSPNDV